MGYKQNDTCLQKVGPAEPIFVLRAQDLLAPEIVLEWARRAEAVGSPPAKVKEAREIAAAMTDWATLRGAKAPD